MNKHRILVFDVETTGLLPKVSKVSKGPLDPTVPKEPKEPKEPSDTCIDLNPYIIQFSFILYNTLNRTIERKHDFYINPPIDISEKITEITGITKDICIQRGVPIMVALECFYNCYMLSGRVIAHNLAFDTEMVKIEIERNREEIEQSAHYCLNIFDATFEKTHGIDQFCTMRYGTNICNIMVLRSVQSQSKDTTEIKEIKEPTYYKKWPTLLELYIHLFNEIPDNLHNSIVDVLVCLRCYLKSYRKIDMDDEAFEQITNMYIHDF